MSIFGKLDTRCLRFPIWEWPCRVGIFLVGIFVGTVCIHSTAYASTAYCFVCVTPSLRFDFSPRVVSATEKQTLPITGLLTNESSSLAPFVGDAYDRWGFSIYFGSLIGETDGFPGVHNSSGPYLYKPPSNFDPYLGHILYPGQSLPLSFGTLTPIGASVPPGTYTSGRFNLNFGTSLQNSDFSLTAAHPLSVSVVKAAKVPAMPAPIDLGLPFAPQIPFASKKGSSVNLLTQVGGLTQDSTVGADTCGYSSGYVDTCHTKNEAYWALDFKNKLQTTKVNVISVSRGTIKEVEAVKETTKDGSVFYYAKIVIDDTSISLKGKDYFSIYQEFDPVEVTSTTTKSEAMTQAVNAVKVRDLNGKLICTGSACDNTGVGKGYTLAPLVGGAGAGRKNLNHLHFQMGYGCTSRDESNPTRKDYKQCSTSSAPIENVRIGGKYLKQFKLTNFGDYTIVQTAPGYTTNKGKVKAGRFKVTSTPGAPAPTACSVTSGSGCPVPVMPSSVANNRYQYAFSANPNKTFYIDPALATGYDYQILSGPLFASADFPLVGNGLYDLWTFDTNADEYVFDSKVQAGVAVDFGPAGVDRFRITGIDASAAIRPGDPFGFVTGLTFTGAGSVSLSQTPLLGSTDVPEPSSLALLAAGVLALGLLRHRF